MLDHPARPHHHDLVGDLPDHRQVVADEQVRQAESGLQLGKQFQDLRLHHDVERGDRLVTHQDLRSQRQGTRDRDPLALPAGQFAWSPVQQRRRQRDLLAEFADGLLTLTAVADPMDPQRFVDECATEYIGSRLP